MLLYCNFISLYGHIMILLFFIIVLLLYSVIVLLYYRVVISYYHIVIFIDLVPNHVCLLRRSHISMSWNYLCSYMHRFAVHICSMFSKHICFMIFGSTTLGAQAIGPPGAHGALHFFRFMFKLHGLLAYLYVCELCLCVH